MFVLVSLISISICIVYIHVAVTAQDPELIAGAEKKVNQRTHSAGNGTRATTGRPNAVAAQKGR